MTPVSFCRKKRLYIIYLKKYTRKRSLNKQASTTLTNKLANQKNQASKKHWEERKHFSTKKKKSIFIHLDFKA